MPPEAGRMRRVDKNNNLPGDDFVVVGSGYEAGFDAGYAKGYADGLDESAGDPRVDRLESGFQAIHAAANGEYSREDLIALDALQAGRDFAVRLVRLERCVLELQAHAKEHGWQDVDEPISALLAYQSR